MTGSLGLLRERNDKLALNLQEIKEGRKSALRKEGREGREGGTSSMES